MVHPTRRPNPDPLGPATPAEADDDHTRRDAVRAAGLLAMLGPALGLEVAALYGYQQQLGLLAAYGPADLLPAIGPALDASLPGLAMLRRRPLQLPDADVPAALAPPGAPALCLPLLADDEPLGALYLARPAGAPRFSPADELLATLAADREAASIQLGRLHARLRANERITAQVIESIPSSLVVVDPQLRVVAVNRNFLDKARRQARSTIGRRVDEIFPAVLARYLRLDAKIQAVLRSGQPFSGDQISYRAPGLPTRIFFYRLIPLRGTSGVEHVLLLMDDVTERERLGEEVRRAERHLASVVECASDLVISLDPAGLVVSWNRAAERISGLRADLACGRSLASLCAPAQRHLIDAMIAQLAGGRDGQRVEVDLLTSNEGAAVPIAWNGAPMYDDNGQVAALVMVGYDLTERRRLEQQLIQSAKSASLGVMASGIAHEIRNPLGIIAASAQLLLERPCADPLHRDGAERIYGAARRAATIIEDMLRFARHDRAPPQPISLNALVGEALALIVAHPLMHAIALRQDLDPAVPLIYGNAGLLRQVLTNLLLNACQAMPDGGALAVRTAYADGMALVAVADSGRGIPSDLIGQIFDPFFTTRPVGQGSGLGLAISDSIVRQHHGTIAVDSHPGAGSTFTVRLPIAEQAWPNAEPPA